MRAYNRKVYILRNDDGKIVKPWSRKSPLYYNGTRAFEAAKKLTRTFGKVSVYELQIVDNYTWVGSVNPEKDRE